MKELYTSPEAKLISFEAEERLASNVEGFDFSEDPTSTLTTDITYNFFDLGL